MHTTPNKIRAHSPCESGWKKLLSHLGKTTADDEPLPFLTILESNGFEDAMKWRPIETAPKDGTDLLLWCGWCITGFRDENGFWTEDGTQSIQMVTHWIPSPPPPGEEQSNG